MAEHQVAIVTGACSGIGLAMTHHLLAKKHYRVVLADINAKKGAQLAEELGSSTIFVKTDVSSWESQAALFKAAYAWGNGHINFLAANAGVFDGENMLNGLKDAKNAEPKKPDMSPIEVNQIGVMYGVHLFLHYARQSGRRGGKIVVTASLAGTYPIPIFPLYCASKASLISYARSIAPRLIRSTGTTINILAPAFVDTAMAIDLKDMLPPEFWTPMATLIEAFSMFVDDESGRTGVVLEITGTTLAERGLPPSLSEEQAQLAVSWREITGMLVEPWDGNLVI